jgi:hypothetical protein
VENPQAEKKSNANPCDNDDLEQKEFLAANEVLVQEAIFQALKANFMKPKEGEMSPFLHYHM